MNRSVLTTERVVFCLLVLGFGLVVTFAGTERESSNSAPIEVVERIVRARAAHEDRVALEAYEKRNAEIAPSGEDAGPPNPGNAALLYY